MISFLVPTIGRPTLAETLRSIETYPGDEIIVVGDGASPTFSARAIAAIHDTKRTRFVSCPPGKDWGHTERNIATPLARGQYIAHIDDDDVYAPGTRALMEDAIRKTPGRPVLFRMRFPNGITLWADEGLRCGNVGTPMMLIPNRPTMLGTWGSFVGGDCHFLETMKWGANEIVWRPEIIALLGHDIGAAV